MMEKFKDVCDLLSEGFLYDGVYDILVDSPYAKQLPPARRDKYLTRAIDVMDMCINCFNYFRATEKGQRYTLNDPINSLRIYTRVLKSLRNVLKEKVYKPMSVQEAEKFVLDKLNRYKEILTCIKNGKEVSNEEKQEIIDLFQEMRKDTLSETAHLLQIGYI
jgi:hypothetical protein